MIEEPTNELRFIKRELKATEVYNGRGFKYVLQQKWRVTSRSLGRENTEVVDVSEDWRDVPLVDEE